MFVDIFIRRPILSSVLALVIILAGVIAIPDAAHRAVSGAGAAAGHGQQLLHRRQRTDGRKRRHHPARTGHQRRRRPALHDVEQHQQRRQPGHRHLRAVARPGSGRGGRAEPRLHRARPPAQRGEEHRRHGDQGQHGVCHGRRRLRGKRPVRPAVSQQLPRRLRPRRAQAHPRRCRRPHLRRAQVRDAPVARPDAPGRTRHHGQRRHRRVARAERAGRRRCGRPAPGCLGAALPDQRARRRTAHRAGAVREHHRQGRQRRHADPAGRGGPRRDRRGGLQQRAPIQRRRGRGLCRHSAAHGQRPRRVRTGARRARHGSRRTFRPA